MRKRFERPIPFEAASFDGLVPLLSAACFRGRPVDGGRRPGRGAAVLTYRPTVGMAQESSSASIGNYTLDRTIGLGASAKVYLGTHKGTGRSLRSRS